MGHTSNKALLSFFPNITRFFRKKFTFHTCTPGKTTTKFYKDRTGYKTEFVQFFALTTFTRHQFRVYLLKAFYSTFDYQSKKFFSFVSTLRCSIYHKKLHHSNVILTLFLLQSFITGCR